MDEKTKPTETEPGREPSLYAPYTPKPEVKTTRRPFARAVRGLILLAVIAGASYATYQIVKTAQTPQKPPSGRAARDKTTTVSVATIGKGDIRVIVNALGTVTPLATVTVRTQINGQLQEVKFTEGSMVQKDELLAIIDDRPYQALRNQYLGQKARDQGFLEQAIADNERYQILLKQNSIAKQQAEDQKYVIKQYQGSVQTDEALIQQQDVNIAYTRIKSPITGRVGLRLVDQGNYVQTSDATGIAVLTQLQPISVLFSIPEDNLPEVMAEQKTGATLTVNTLDRANAKQLGAGKVATLDNQIDTTTGTVRVRALFDNVDNKLYPNQFVNVQLLVTTLHDVVTVPVGAVQRGSCDTYVYVVETSKDGDKSLRRCLKLGPIDGDMQQVISGLAPGERVVTSAFDQLSDGGAVRLPGAGGGGGGGGKGGGGGDGAGGRQRDGAPGDGQPPRRRRGQGGQ
jgi:multidrug efflux system membrane fusion protein